MHTCSSANILGGSWLDATFGAGPSATATDALEGDSGTAPAAVAASTVQTSGVSAGTQDFEEAADAPPPPSSGASPLTGRMRDVCRAIW